MQVFRSAICCLIFTVMLGQHALAQNRVPVVKRSDLVTGNKIPALQADATVAANGDIIASGEMQGDVLPGDKVTFVRSTDGGKTWSEPYLIMEADEPATQGVAVQALYTREDGVILLNRLVAEMLGGLDSRELIVNEIMASEDHGRTFHHLADLPFHPAGLNAPYLQMVKLPDGGLILPGFVENHGNGYWRSDDDGRTWSEFRVVWQDPPTGAKKALHFNETSYVVLDEKSILAVARNDVDKVFYTIRSDDLGQTWSEPRALNLLGGSPALHRMKDGMLLLAYRDAGRPGLALAVSEDEGEHWRYAYELPKPEGVSEFHASHWTRPADDEHWQPGEGHIGYPAFLDLPDGDVYVVWHVQDRNMSVAEGLPNFRLVGTLLSGDERAHANEQVFTAAQIGTLLRAQQRTGSPVIATLLDTQQSEGLTITPLRIENRDSPEAEVHDAQDDLFYVINGEATFHLGGELVETWEYSPGNRAGKGTTGDIRQYHVGPGDLVFVPRGTVHRITCPDGFVEVLVIKQAD